jgi:hypothetical protein
MLGIGGSLQTPSSFQSPGDKHKRAVAKIHASLSKEGDGNSSPESFSDGEGKTKKKEKKRKRVEMVKKKLDMERSNGDGSWISLAQVILEGKQEMQSDKSKNGVTYAIIGSSGCGKSTMIRKVLLEQVYDDKKFMVQIFTESAKSDAFKELGKDVLVDSKGLDVDNINFCYHMNEEYDKDYNFVIILDDVIKIKYVDLVERMFLTMRNTNITSVVSLQYPYLIPKSIRTSVYFTFLFHMNNDEAVEAVVRGWLSSYLPGKNIREKMKFYLTWTLGPDKQGHQFFVRDNLNHKIYKCDTEYRCNELPLISVMEDTSQPQKKRSRIIYPEEEHNPQVDTVEEVNK